MKFFETKCAKFEFKSIILKFSFFITTLMIGVFIYVLYFYPKDKIIDKKEFENNFVTLNEILLSTENLSDNEVLEVLPKCRIEILEEEFQKKPSSEVAIEICKIHFEDNDFKNSLHWSIEANKLDDTLVEAWLYFAKSKFNLNLKQDAIIALKLFLENYESSEAKKLLSEYLKDEIKPRKSQDEIRVIITKVKKLFYQNPNFEDAKTLAQNYIEIKNFKNSMFWVNKMAQFNQNSKDVYILKTKYI